MKKLCAVAFSGLIGLGLFAGPAAASWWGNWCCDKHGPKIKCRQYNAFSPYCCGPLPCGYQYENDGHGQTVCDDGHPTGPVVIDGSSKVITTPAEGGKKTEKGESIEAPKGAPQSALPSTIPPQLPRQPVLRPPFPPQQFLQQPYAQPGYPQYGIPQQGYPQLVNPYAQYPIPQSPYPNPAFGAYPNPAFGQAPGYSGYPIGPGLMPQGGGYAPGYWGGNSPTGGR